MADRDLFEHFQRMRRDMDALLGSQGGAGLARRGQEFTPAVDVVYCTEPARAIITAELSGVEVEKLDLEIQGRKLILSGRRIPAAQKGEVYQQVEIQRGSFRRVIELAADVRGEEAKARYEDGMLQVEVPLVKQGSRLRSVPIEPSKPSPQNPPHTSGGGGSARGGVLGPRNSAAIPSALRPGHARSGARQPHTSSSETTSKRSAPGSS